MRHKMRTGKLSRKWDQRNALLRNLAKSLIDSGKLQTTHAKAKALVQFVEPLITHARKANELPSEKKAEKLHHVRMVAREITDRTLVKKLFNDIGPKFKDFDKGGYTRIVKIGNRRGDMAPISVVMLNLENEKD